MLISHFSNKKRKSENKKRNKIIKRDQRREGGRNEIEGSSLPEKHIEEENPIVQVNTAGSSLRSGFRFGAKAMAEVVRMAIDGEDESKPNGQDQPKKTLKRKRATLTPKQQQQLLNIRGEVVNRKEPRLRN